MSALRFAVVLAGCGNKDGAEIQEAVLTLLAIDQLKGHYQCYAPDIQQARTLNFLTNEPMAEQRNVLVEAARIARSDIKPLSSLKVEDIDILVLPGGTGVAYNLCSYATDGTAMKINLDLQRVVLETFQAKKPIGALCIAPVILAKLIPEAVITFGSDEKANHACKAIGAKPIDALAHEVIVDEANRLVSTPCYMCQTTIGEMYQGIYKLIATLTRMST